MSSKLRRYEVLFPLQFKDGACVKQIELWLVSYPIEIE